MSDWKSTQELVHTVRQHRKQSLADPNHFVFSEDDDRLYFLGSLHRHGKQDLLTADVGSKGQPEPLFHTQTTTTQLSREEELLRERQRISATGVTSFIYHAAARKLVVPAAGGLSQCGLEGKEEKILVPIPLNREGGATINPTFAPSNASLLAYIKDNDLWVTTTMPDGCHRITNVAAPGRTAGVACYIVQEEFDRFTGYWWQPKATHKDRLHILYEEVDETAVREIAIQRYANLQDSQEQYHYPRTGEDNATVTIKLATVDVSNNNKLQSNTSGLPFDLTQVVSWCEYIVRLGWTPCGENVWVQVLNRNQTKTAIIAIPISVFGSVDVDAALKKVVILLEEESDVWINVDDCTKFMGPKQPDDQVFEFLWASERTGYRHIYHCTVKAGESPNWAAVTSGDWVVHKTPVQCDENGTVYFSGTKDTPVEKHFYRCRRTSEDKWGCPERLTKPGYSHEVTMNNRFTAFVTVYSSLKEPPVCELWAIKASSSSGDSSFSSEFLYRIADVPGLNGLDPPELISFQSVEGHTVYGHVYRPSTSSTSPLPTILNVYGGPHVQLVTNTYQGIRRLRLHLLAEAGYVVLVFDCRGSACRGLKFESILKHNMGTVEIKEQVEALEHCLSIKEYNIDRNRVGIQGWSYGGYLALMGMAQRPDVFKVAIAGAPVTCWEAYDTGYTERYMDTPFNNPEGYIAGSVVERAKDFPDEQGRLMIIHGLIDENVHFCHTAIFTNALINHGKPYQLQVYPTERHGVRGHLSAEHYETTTLFFYKQNL